MCYAPGPEILFRWAELFLALLKLDSAPDENIFAPLPKIMKSAPDLENLDMPLLESNSHILKHLFCYLIPNF